MKYLVDEKEVDIYIKKDRNGWYAAYKHDEIIMYFTIQCYFAAWSFATKNKIYWASYEDLEKAVNTKYRCLEIMDFDLGVA